MHNRYPLLVVHQTADCMCTISLSVSDCCTNYRIERYSGLKEIHQSDNLVLLSKAWLDINGTKNDVRRGMVLKANPLCMEFECASREMNLKLFLRLHRQPFVTAILYRRPVQSRKRNQLHLSVRTNASTLKFAILRNFLVVALWVPDM